LLKRKPIYLYVNHPVVSTCKNQ